MKVKKYVGQTAHEAMLKLKNELGPDAVILNTKTIRDKGLFGMFKKPLVEITAAYEDKDLISKNSRQTSYDNKLIDINQELKELKNIVLSLSNRKLTSEEFSPRLNNFHNIMIKNGVNPLISSRILNEIEEDVSLESKDNSTIRKILKYTLTEKLGNPKIINIDKKPKTIFFVGSTGVGKTTTLAKIAANFVLENKYDIGLITLDTYRIAAVDQLKVYAEILKLPLEVAYNKEDLIKSLNKLGQKDIILIDTAGRSHNNLKQIEELKEILNLVEEKEVYLLLDSTVDYGVLNSIINCYSFLNDYKLIVTKVDEAKNYGTFVNIKYLTDKEFSYFTIGQNVPEDIKIVNIQEIVEKILEESLND
ncbi:MAG: flagellar biosynthesis protein FlhF [Tissierellia bacterium]|nr:flagellar biosynthesis protein FlhF [Tissierellia bacterium]